MSTLNICLMSLDVWLDHGTIVIITVTGKLSKLLTGQGDDISEHFTFKELTKGTLEKIMKSRSG